MTQARVGVVVLTCRRPEAVLRTLDKLAALPEQPPIAVVDNGTGDGTAARIARLFPQVELVTAPGNLGAAARNLGVLRLMTPYIAFCNDDTWWSPGSLARAAQLLDSFPRVGVLSPRLLIGPEQRQDEACLAMAQRPLPSLGLPGLAVMGFSAGACVFRRQAFLEAGGYEPHLFLGEEEALLALDLATHGWAMVYDPDLIAHRYPTPPDDSTERGCCSPAMPSGRPGCDVPCWLPYARRRRPSNVAHRE